MKRMKRIWVLGLLLMAFHTYAQEKVLSHIPLSGVRVQDFIPRGYDTLDGGIAYGDLNKDGRSDIVLALQQHGDDTDPPRLLIVLLRSDKGYRLAGKSSSALLCKSCGGVYGDPFAALQIRNGILQIDHYGGSAWRWTVTQKFRYQQDGLYLIGTTRDWWWNIEDCNGTIGDAGRRYKDINWLTGSEEVIERTDDCKLIKHLKLKHKVRPLIRLEAFVEKN